MRGRRGWPGSGARGRWRCTAGCGTTPLPHSVAFVARPDGNVTANVRDVDGPLREAWGPINRKYADAPELCTEAFMAEYGHNLRNVPMPASQMAGGLLRKRVRAMSPSSIGLDGLSLRDL